MLDSLYFMFMILFLLFTVYCFFNVIVLSPPPVIAFVTVIVISFVASAFTAVAAEIVISAVPSSAITEGGFAMPAQALLTSETAITEPL